MHPRNVHGPDHVHDGSGSQDFDPLLLSLIHRGAFPVPFWCPSPAPTFPLQNCHLIAFPLVKHHAVRDHQPVPPHGEVSISIPPVHMQDFIKGLAFGGFEVRALGVGHRDQ